MKTDNGQNNKLIGPICISITPGEKPKAKLY
jgi:hypothetical protein